MIRTRRAALGALVMLLTTASAAADPPRTRRWTFEVEILTGSRAGQRFDGEFLVGALPRRGTGVVPVETFAFSYGGERFTQTDLPVRVRFARGEPVELLGVGGPNHLRFGFTEGFEREQFGRPEEGFILRGEPYFGYLDPSTIVDGAGRVRFTRAR